MRSSATPFLERELLLASAGSGKTFQLSSRLIGLLSAGVPPEEILASTFTRKAAGEILDRVLLRLARATLDPEEARELGRHLPRAEGGGDLTPEECGRILGATVASLHRLQVHTLDAFFHRLIRLFEMELGLPGRWEIVDEPVMERLRSRALERSLREGDTGALVELVRLAGRGEADRSVHTLLLTHLTALLALHREFTPGAGRLGGDGRPSGTGGSEGDDDLLHLALEALADAEVPRTQKGLPRAHWVRALGSIREAVEAGAWDELVGQKLVARVIGGELEYDRAPIEPDVAGPIEAILKVAVVRKREEVRGRLGALGRFLPAYDGHLRRLQWEEGAFDFNDLAHTLLPGSGRTPVEHLEDLHYRLDGRIRHILLDEFQDTSTLQWGVLRPLVGEILSGYEGERAVFIVADPKQSIYGWRSGEPRIIDGIRSDFGLEPSSLARSWRSSQTVLDLVNRVFEDPAGNAVVQAAGIGNHAARWAAHFEPHEAAHEDLPGHVLIEAGPDGVEADAGVSGDVLLRHTARRVAELHRRAPGATIGILTRKNATATRLIAELRELDVGASEEGGVPVTDSAAVICVLAALRLADHPGDRISRYLVATSPLGALAGLGDWRSDEAAARTSRSLRARLLREGYGRTLSGWYHRLAPGLSPRDTSRLRSLMELGYRWDDRPTLRPGDFVRTVESSRVESPADEDIRVMTVHRAKGLEFDAVFLPELDGLSLSPGGLPPFLPEREGGGAGPVRRILPGVSSAWEPLFPELGEAARQHRESVARDALSAVYVALTRARHAVHVILRPDARGNSSAKSGARFIREALGLPKEVVPGEVLWERGSPDGWEARFLSAAEGDTGAGRRRRTERPLRLAERERKRLLGRRSPSEMEGGEVVRLGALLRPIPREALDRGSLVHLWMEQVQWLAPEGPDREALLRLARSRVPGVRDPESLLDELIGQLEAPAIRALLRRESYPDGTRVERERPFVVREGGQVVQGVADRVVYLPGEGGARLQIVDWKSDRIGPDPDEVAERIAFYSPQIRAYCRALAKAEGADPSRVEGVLAFLETGRVVSVPADEGAGPGTERGE